jgi:hypothetical protein
MGQTRGTKPVPTVKQQKAINGFLAVLAGDTTKTVTQIMRDAGYTESTATGWSNVMKGLRPHLQPHLDWLEMHRAQIMARMDEKIGTADYGELVRALDTVTKNHQLLGGKATQRFDLPDEDRRRIEGMLDEDL